MNASNLIRIIPDFPKPGIIFKDITPLLANAEAFREVCNQIAEHATDVEYIAGVEARGFIFAAAVAAISNKGLIPIRKSGKLPGKTFSNSYDLEYGKATLEIHSDLIPTGGTVLLVDDVLATYVVPLLVTISPIKNAVLAVQAPRLLFLCSRTSILNGRTA
mgnify:CR=1 FL=1